MYVQQLSIWMETAPSVTDVEVINNIPSIMSTISQQQGKVTPLRRIPPKKQKRAAPPIPPNSGTTDPNENIENDDCVMGESSDLLQSQWEKHMNKEGFVVKKSNLEIYLKDDVIQAMVFEKYV
ncbi:hypothetical protein H5410_014100 [Solanum commersonii]|uniref:Uncharacterized protein n=1 Tax=Solanum commersonii TaxID=4109 RepID=A0A9J5ZQD8_SOLCO|nr:hypothetical protein H5410_014100 [Solanum commersonii]